MADLILGGTTVTVATPGVPTLTMAPPAPSSVVVLPVAGPQGLPGDESSGSALAAHIASPTPHPAYDVDLQDLSILLENGMA